MNALRADLHQLIRLMKSAPCAWKGLYGLWNTVCSKNADKQSSVLWSLNRWLRKMKLAVRINTNVLITKIKQKESNKRFKGDKDDSPIS